ncbi:MAG: bifunctional precorrin-2 dehydrogenase/sirohydrochlorin ferrochelatase [Methanocellales archaeon]|nr:bifunctional precorrin-2 dehydrogenase/sirohydrochlorin ferrochelatase [Methanocellales archaeon]MDD3291938.1 bifunctional precorrin-2 dehydrogenase/sirohydrochlorin ferrochelatase [Methanocellales archaeon]MDD5235661.1 bifunctional precorrin-2 dehydrogenase/sirohydrochlorin ferrochelatase [Methanocellales archaeon]MDD5485508.1 bifunctional precorrin-2 dehydrogenase/sirohydrochlorin ferrochelatase [Methanocellales archaeon]
MSKLLPLVIDLESKKIVIFGGGLVGERKAKLFQGADLTVVSKDFTSTLCKLKDEGYIKLIESDLGNIKIESLIKDAFMVVPATDDLALNSKITAMAKKHKILVNSVDRVDDVIIPSVLKRGDITIGISTLGKSPAMSKLIRKKVEHIIDEKYADMVKLQCEIRALLKQQVKDHKLRKRILLSILFDEEIWQSMGDYDKARDLAISKWIDRA